jgi:hypothetical protein
MVLSGPAFHGGHVARFDHGSRGFRHFRNFGVFAAAPIIVGDDYCWRLVRTQYGLRRMWVCDNNYDFNYDY